MSIPAQGIIRRCVDTLQDTTSIRWPINELVRYFNDAQREVVLYRPDAMVTNAAITCVAGSRQMLPANGSKLIEVVSNTDGQRRAVRQVNREILDAQMPNWHNLPGSAEIRHFMYDPRDPRVFYVYPPALATARLNIVYAAYPTDIAEPADGALFSNVLGTLSLPEIYANAVQDYILYRAYTKDSEYAGNANRAQAHYGAFANALGIEIKATVNVAPNPLGNPNQPRMTSN